MRFIITIVLALGTTAPSLAAAPVSGEAVYKQRCAACHDSASPRVPPRDELKKLSVPRILRAMDFGLMNNVATKLTQEEREAVAAYLGIPGGSDQPPPSAYCSNRTVTLNGRTKGEWNGWSPTFNNTRYQSNESAGIALGQVSRLKLKWAYGFEGDIIAFAQPAILDGHLFVGSAGGLVQALSADSGCVKWVFQAS